MKSSGRSSYIRVFAAAGVAVLLAGFVILRGASAPKKAPRPYTTWSAFGGTKDSMQYSALTQINKTNVNQLEQVLVLPRAGAGTRQVLIQPAGRRQRHVCRREGQPRDCRSGRGHRKGALDPPVRRETQPTAATPIGRARTARTGGLSSRSTATCIRDRRAHRR